MSSINRNKIDKSEYKIELEGYFTVFVKSYIFGCYHILGYVFDSESPTFESFLTNKKDLDYVLISLKHNLKDFCKGGFNG